MAQSPRAAEPLLHAAARYAMPFVAVAGATGLHFAFMRVWGHDFPYIFFFPVALVAGLYGGRGPGILAVVLATLASQYFFIEPIYSFAVSGFSDALSLASFAGVMFMIAFVSAGHRRGWLELARVSERHAAFIRQSTEGIWRFELERPLSTLLKEDDQLANFFRYGFLAECNDAMARMYGFASASEMIGKRLEDILVPSDRMNIDYLRGFIRSGYRLTGAESHEVDREGRRKYFLNGLVGIVENGHLVRVWGTQVDITERKRAEHALEETAEELAASNRELEEFAYVASHDLQEPVRKILTYGERLRLRLGGIPAEDLDGLDRLLGAAKRMRSVIEDLLLFSRVARADTSFEQVSLNDVLDDVLADLEVAVDESKAVVRVEELPEVYANPSQMRHVFQNLISNSIKFARIGVAPIVEVRMQSADGGRVEIEVSDNGIGFDEKYVDRIFKPFQRLHGRDHYQGTGIGLSIAHKIIQRHGGSIRASSRPGEGTSFVVTLPLDRIDAGSKLH